ncbi:hypothetical protein [Pseudaminobacter sp. NGMCC 1.201702]|uniref:hypothetical protein n=1 Tax=Pseudaminobacter sp. NGMCC 1.201702 TaxID=3391825 RepID=UPI0039EE02F6
MEAPSTISGLIGNWDKLTEFAADVGCGYEAARKMRDRESIAPEHWAKVIAACEQRGIKGITYEWLARRRAAAADKEAAA